MSTNLATKKSRSNKLMNNLINGLFYGVQDTEEQALEEFFTLYSKAHQEMYDAENFFNNVVDPELVDHAIYKMEAAKSKFVYLLKQAKEKNIRVDI